MALKVFDYIEQYNEMLEKLLFISKDLVYLSQKQDIAGIELQSQNRDRLVNIMSKLQFKLEQFLLASGETLSPETIQTLAAWDKDVRLVIADIQELDQQCVFHLTNSKEQIGQEISLVHKNKNSIQGYNLNKIN